MRKFIRIFVGIMALMAVFFVVLSAALFPVLLVFATDDARYFALLLLTVPAVAAGVTVLIGEY